MHTRDVGYLRGGRGIRARTNRVARLLSEYSVRLLLLLLLWIRPNIITHFELL